MWKVVNGKIEKTGQEVFFPAKMNEKGQILKMGSVCYTANKAHKICDWLNAKER